MTFKTFSKGKFKAFGKRPKQFRPKTPALPRPFDSTDDTLDRIVRILGDQRQAKRVWSWQQRYPNGTIPEMVVLDWLERHHIRYVYQAIAFGGRRRKGGLVPDFLVPEGGQARVIQVQGDYWHSRKRKGYYDTAVSMRLLGKMVEGYRVTDVVEVWESDLYRNTEVTMVKAMAGMSSR